MPLIFLIIALSLIFPANSFAHELPNLGDVSRATISAHEERQLGVNIMRQIRADPSYMDDPEIASYLSNLGHRLIVNSDEADANQLFEFFAVDDPSINAFALPGGFMGFNSGLIIAAQSESELAAVKAAQRPVELGQQMLELQIRHARLWYAGQRDNWTLAVFQLAEFREAIDGIVEANGEHPALQPERLADVMPMHMGPPLKALQAAVDGKDRAAFTAAYDQLTAACNACHEAASFGFNRFQRPRTPLLDNQQYGTAPDAAD